MGELEREREREDFNKIDYIFALCLNQSIRNGSTCYGLRWYRWEKRTQNPFQLSSIFFADKRRNEACGFFSLKNPHWLVTDSKPNQTFFKLFTMDIKQMLNELRTVDDGKTKRYAKGKMVASS